MEVSGLPAEYSKENAPNTLPFFLIDYFKQKGITGASLANVSGYLSCIADKNRYNPVEEFIAQGEWDGVDRVKETCDMIGISDPQHCTYVKKWLIQCVAMALNGDEAPVGADGVLAVSYTHLHLCGCKRQGTGYHVRCRMPVRLIFPVWQTDERLCS